MKKRISAMNIGLTRRGFLGTAAGGAVAAIGLPVLVPSSVFGAEAPSNRVTMGCIGVGGMGTRNLRAFLNRRDVQILAACDPVRANNEYGHWYRSGWKGSWFGREPAQKIVNAHYATRKRSRRYRVCTAHVDFREVLARDDIDAVTVVTPDHWHAPISIAAAKARKDIYCEKPLTLTIDEGKAMVRAVRRYGVVLQTGSHRRSEALSRFMCQLVRNGRLGKIQRVEVRVGPNHRTAPAGAWTPTAAPAWLDYDMWLGPAPLAAYHKDRCLYKFRFILDYSGGNLTNLGAHSMDLVQWGLGTDHTGPVEIEDQGGVFPADGLFDVATDVRFRARYADGTELICRTGNPDAYVRFVGSDGWISYGSGQGCRSEPASLLKETIGPNEIHLYRSDNHYENFIDCVRTRTEPAAPVEVGHRSASICHLGNIAMMMRRKLTWDPLAERFIGDDQANRLLARPLRAPWRLW